MKSNAMLCLTEVIDNYFLERSSVNLYLDESLVSPLTMASFFLSSVDRIVEMYKMKIYPFFLGQ